MKRVYLSLPRGRLALSRTAGQGGPLLRAVDASVQALKKQIDAAVIVQQLGIVHFGFIERLERNLMNEFQRTAAYSLGVHVDVQIGMFHFCTKKLEG